MVPLPHTPWRALVVALAAAASAFGQTAVEWQHNGDGSWSNDTSWSSGSAPGNSEKAALKKAVIVTANGAADASVKGLDIGDAGATAIFDFLNAGYVLRLGSSISSWTAGKVEMRRTSGIYGNGIGNTILNLSPGVELLYSTESLTRYLYNLYVSNGGTIRNTSGTLYFSSSTVANLATGLIHADGADIRIASGTLLQNAGTLRATGAGRLFIDNTITSANLGAVDLVDGGRALITGTIDNAAATLNAPSGGRYELYGGRIVGGAVAANALTFTSQSGTLEGVVLNDSLNLPASASVHLTGNATFTGTNATLGEYSLLYWEQNGTVDGRAITMANGSRVYVNGNYTLTLGNATTVTGDIQADTSGSAGAGITVQGNVTHNTASASGSISAPALNLQGTLTHSATNGILTVGQTWGTYVTRNTGVINLDAAGGTLYLDGAFDNTGGTLNALQGKIVFRGDNVTSKLTGGTINLAADTHAYLAGTLDNTGTVPLSAPTGGPFELYGGTVRGGSIAAGALAFTSSGGYLDGATLLGDLTLGAYAHVRLKGNATFAGGNATLGLGSTVFWHQSGRLDGKAFSFGSSSSLQLADAGSSLTLGNTTTATGALYITGYASGQELTLDGTLTHTSASTGYLQAPSLLNRGTITNTATNGALSIGTAGHTTRNTGTITVNGTGATIYLEDGFDNTGGTLNATLGRFILRGSNTTAHLNGGTINIGPTGNVFLNGTLDNTAATLAVPASGRYELYGGIIENGLVAAGALAFTSSGGKLRGVALQDDLVLPTFGSVRLENGTTIAGNVTLGSSSWLTWAQTGTLASKLVTFGSNSGLHLVGGNTTLTLDAASSVTGDIQLYTDGSAGGVIENAGDLTQTASSAGYLAAPTLRNSGTIAVTGTNASLTVGSNSAGYSLRNTGSITVDGTGAILYLDGSLDNTGGTLNANNGLLIFRYTHATPQLNAGTVNIGAAGHVYLSGTIDNTGHTLNKPASGAYELYSGMIRNGSIADGALSFTSSGGTLENVALLGNVTLPASTSVTWTNGTTLATSGARLELGANSWVYWQQNGIIDDATVAMGANSSIYLSGENRELTIGTSARLSGDVSVHSSGYAGTRLTNLGNVTHTTGTGYLYAQTVTNPGTIEVTGGTLYLGYSGGSATFANPGTGTIRLDGGNAYVNTAAAQPLVNEGRIHLRSGTLYTQDRVTNASGGWIGGSGVIHGNLVLAGGTLSPGNDGVGNLRLNYGQLTVTGAATFAVDIDGSVSDQLIFQSPTGIIDLGSGLISLSINLLSAPTADATFTLVSIASSGFGLAGRFAGLPNSGNTITALYGGNAFTFSINYQPSFVSLSYNPVVVPEPSTYALMGGGLAVVAWMYRRRRKHS